jgi:dephospho-CoA kinase
VSLLVGLTGGVGSGKSTVAHRLQELGAAVVDTDEIAHRLTGAGGAAMAAIAREFGDAYVRADGGLDRPAMRRLAFADPEARRRLESILHPLIRGEALAEVARATGPYTVLVVPLLLETGAYRGQVQRVLVVDCPVELQIERTMQRSGLTLGEVEAIVAAQLPRARRLAQADDVVDNSGPIEAARTQAERLHRRYLELAEARRN